jgi:hypothetical protein
MRDLVRCRVGTWQTQLIAAISRGFTRHSMTRRSVAGIVTGDPLDKRRSPAQTNEIGMPTKSQRNQ